MAIGRVADFGDGTYFASVEYDEPGPFCVMNGPEDVSAEEAVAWARRQGESEPGEPVAWNVMVSTGWYRDDREDVAARLAAALGGDARATLDEAGFSVAFAVTARSHVEASEQASEAVRAAWAATGIAAEPGDDFDVSGISVERRRSSS